MARLSAARTTLNAATPNELAGEDGPAEAANARRQVARNRSGERVSTSLCEAGRFGPYVQLGEAEEKEKPKRSSLPKGVDAENRSIFQLALKLLSLPRIVGAHPEDGEPIEAGLGRFGPFVKHGKIYANVKEFEELFEIGLNRAVTLIAEKKEKGGGRGRCSQGV